MLKTLFALAGLACVAVAQGEGRAVAVRSLLPFRTPSLQVPAEPKTAIPNEDTSQVRDASHRAEGNNGATQLLELLAERHRTFIEQDELTLLADSSRLTVSGSKHAVRNYLAEFDALSAVMTRSIRVTAWRLELPDGPLPQAFLDGARLADLLANCQTLWTGEAVTRSGGVIRLGDERWTNYVRDLDAEVAEKAQIDDPKIDALFAGLHVQASVHLLPGDELLVHGSWHVSDRISMTAFSTGEERPYVELPYHRSVYLTFDGRLRSGHALVAAARDESEDGLKTLLVIRAILIDSAPTLPNGLYAVPLSAWHESTQSQWTMAADHFPGDDAVDEGNDHDTPLLAPTDVESLLKPADASAALIGHTLVMSTDQAGIDRTERLLRRLVDAQTHRARLHVARSTALGRTPSELMIPVCVHREARAFVGTERAVVGDFEVEIATRAATGNPVVHTTRAGIWSRLLVRSAGEGTGTTRWDIEGLWRSARPLALREVKVAAAVPMKLLLPDYRSRVWPWDGSIQTGTLHNLSPDLTIELRPQP